MDVPNTSFMPSPEVNSSIIKLDILKEPAIYVENEKLFFKIIKLAFMQKRKTLVNALANGGLLNNKCDVEKMIQELGLDTKIRGEKLTLEDFRNITNYCGQLTK
jgi:16S rRNA (adenine1518-N6/adenine1519-N6)-dimethyltransferase